MAAIASTNSEDPAARGQTYDVNSKPPPFGHSIKHFWAFDPGYVNLNNGSYGSLPMPVLFACTKLTMLAENNPDKFHRIGYMPMLKEARNRVADLVGAPHDDLVLVPNATHGLNTILRNFEWREGDVIMGASTTYGAIQCTAQYLADRTEQPRPTLHSVLYTFPMTHAEILERFRTQLRGIKELYPNVEFSDVPSDSLPYVEGKAGKNKFVAIIDSMTSNPGVLLPWKEIVQICKEEGVWSVIDGAHSVGQEVLNLKEAKPDFFVSNCHKWLYAKRGCALLYVPARNQHIIKSSLPTSHEYVSPTDEKYSVKFRDSGDDPSFVKIHEWTGTADQVPFLSVTPALEFRKWLGGEKVINAYCHKLAVDGAKRLAEIFGTRVMDETGELTLNLSNVLLPLPIESAEHEIYSSDTLTEINTLFREKLLYEWNTYAGHFFHGGAWWCRCSAQVWLEISDFEYVGKAFTALCQEVQDTILARKIKT
ncbi:PLP-dependent transferase [Amylocystis lapponica]|nr:PLP-dependent transferase [Amylocystis lapponica]